MGLGICAWYDSLIEELLVLNLQRSYWFSTYIIRATPKNIEVIINEWLGFKTHTDFCLVSWLPSKVNLDSASATIFLSSFIYSISVAYYSSISLHLNTLPVLKLLHAGFLWSLYILNTLPSHIVLNYFIFSTMLNSYFSITVHLIWAPVIFLL